MTSEQLLGRILESLTDVVPGTIVTKVVVGDQERVVVVQPGGPHLMVTVSEATLSVAS